MTIKGRFGTKMFRRDDEPDIGDGDIEYVAVYDGAVDYKDDAVMGPVSVGESEAEQFKDEVQGRVQDAEFRRF